MSLCACPVCGDTSGIAIPRLSIDVERPPQIGEPMVCFHCRSIVTIEACENGRPMAMRLMTLDEIAALSDDERIHVLRVRRHLEQAKGLPRMVGCPLCRSAIPYGPGDHPEIGDIGQCPHCTVPLVFEGSHSARVMRPEEWGAIPDDVRLKILKCFRTRLLESLVGIDPP